MYIYFKQEICLYSQKHFAPWRAGDPNSSFLVLKRLGLASRENPAPTRPHPRLAQLPRRRIGGRSPLRAWSCCPFLFFALHPRLPRCHLDAGLSQVPDVPALASHGTHPGWEVAT